MLFNPLKNEIIYLGKGSKQVHVKCECVSKCRIEEAYCACPQVLEGTRIGQ